MRHDKVMRNIQHRHKRVKHMNSFKSARFQRKPRKFAQKPLPGPRVSGLAFRVSGPRSHLLFEFWVSGATFRVLISGSESHLKDGSRVSSPG